MRRLALLCAVLALAACSDNKTSQTPAPVQVGTQSAPGTTANPQVPGNNSSISGNSQASRMQQTGTYSKPQ